MISEISAVMGTLNGAKDLLQSIIGLRDSAAVQAKVVEFNNLIMDAQQRVFAAQEERTALIQKVGELEKKIASLEHWETEKQRYELKKVGFGDRIVVYSLKPGMEGGEPPHSICANCYQKGEKSPLQEEERGGGVYLYCPHCKTNLLSQGFGPVAGR
ncbi:hypothetical protein AB4Z24_05515 [Hyphomicrobium sp. 2TAF46]